MYFVFYRKLESETHMEISQQIEVETSSSITDAARQEQYNGYVEKKRIFFNTKVLLGGGREVDRKKNHFFLISFNVLLLVLFFFGQWTHH